MFLVAKASIIDILIEYLFKLMNQDKKIAQFAIFFLIPLALLGCSTDSQKGTPALFNTKSEAEKAAKNFNCTGAHKMGDKWMPCKSHRVHKKHHNHGGHGHHNH